MKLIECVPNFSEGIDAGIIEQIAGAISAVNGAYLLNVDPGKDANRTVITFAGEPEAVIEAAFHAIQKAGELIDMRTQKGEHPRMGATDVCPLIPISGISMEETALYAQKLAERVGRELNIPVYLYEHAQVDKSRANLSVIRAGEYEGFFEKIKQPGWQPDFGPDEFDAHRGATVIGARNFLIAYNINLDTNSVQLANQIAAEVRESGRVVKDGNLSKRTPGALKAVKAIGWFMKDYGCAQVSMNLTDIDVTPVHIAFDTICEKAAIHGIKVTGSELIGMIPLRCMLDAGGYSLQKQNLSADATEEELVKVAISFLGLDALAPFIPGERIIEYVLDERLSE
jgi:glutamate formiminotransferase / formiminotetrahydrofolate cyclodeaminase